VAAKHGRGMRTYEQNLKCSCNLVYEAAREHGRVDKFLLKRSESAHKEKYSRRP